jgi:hypothetical protein
VVNAVPTPPRLPTKVEMVVRSRATSAAADRRSITSWVIGITGARGSTPGGVNAGSVPKGKLRTMVGNMLGNDSLMSNIMRALHGMVGMIVPVHAALPALAKDYVVRDAQGRRTETIERSHGGDLVRRDAEGRRIGTVEDDVGKQVLRDREGRRVGTVEQGGGGDWIIRDSQGRRRYTIEQGVGDQQIIRDQQGRRIGTVEER